MLQWLTVLFIGFDSITVAKSLIFANFNEFKTIFVGFASLFLLKYSIK